jgi:hypothetical protein
MALETSGFQLSQFDRAPNVPSNIGVVDTKGIYGAVVDALKTNEALRTTQLAQATTDAELGFARQKALTETGLLTPEAEARRAKAQLFTAGAPFEQGLLESRAAAERAKLGYETALSSELNRPENIAAAAKAKTLSSSARGVYDLARMAADPTASKELRDAAGVKLKTVQDANQQFRAALDAGKVDFHTANEDGTRYVRFRDGSSGIVGYPETYTGNAAAYLTGPTVSLGNAPVQVGVATPMAAAAEQVPVGAFAPVAATGAPAAALPGGMLSGVAPRTSGVRASTKGGVLAAESSMKFGGEMSPLAGIEGDEIKKEALSTASEMGKEARKEIRTQLINLTTYENEARKEDDIQKELDALIAEASQKGVMISGGSIFGRGLRALAPGEAAAFQSRLTSVIQHIQLGNMLKLKNASSTGATGFGSLTGPENELLQADYGVLTNKDLPPEGLVAGLERAKRGLNLRRDEALKTIQGRLAVERGIEQQSTSVFQNEKSRFLIPRHPLEVQQAAPGPSTAQQPEIDAESVFPTARSMAPGRLTIGAAPAPEPSQSLVSEPNTESPAEPIDDEYERVDAGAPSPAASYPGRVVTPPAPAPAPAATAPDSAGPTRQYPAYSLMGAIERMPSVSEQGKIAADIAAYPGRTIDMLSRYGAAGLQGIATGNYTVPEKGPLQTIGETIGGALAGSSVKQERESIRQDNEILRTKPNSWEAYNIRRKMGMRQPEEPASKETPAVEQTSAPASAPAKEPVIKLTEEQLPQIKLSPEAAKTARQLLSQYEAAEKERNREQVVPELSAAEGGNQGSLKSSQILRQLLAVLTGGTPSVEPRLEVDREGTRALTNDRMRREEMFRTLRASPRR